MGIYNIVLQVPLQVIQSGIGPFFFTCGRADSVTRH